MSSIEDGESLSWKKIDYDFFLTKLGEFGWFQKKALFWLWLPAFVGGIVSVFILAKHPDILPQVVVTSAFSVHEASYDGFYCKDISICNSTDRSGSLAPPPNQSSHFPAPFIVMARKPHFWS